MDYCMELNSALRKYEDDIQAGHNEAAQYWKGQADVYALLCALGEESKLLIDIMEHKVTGAGRVTDIEKARSTPCKCFSSDGDIYAWSPGVLGLISQKKSPKQYADACQMGCEPSSSSAQERFDRFKKAIDEAHSDYEKSGDGITAWWDAVARSMEKNMVTV